VVVLALEIRRQRRQSLAARHGDRLVDLQREWVVELLDRDTRGVQLWAASHSPRTCPHTSSTSRGPLPASMAARVMVAD
jgi:hypothetical protein